MELASRQSSFAFAKRSMSLQGSVMLGACTGVHSCSSSFRMHLDTFCWLSFHWGRHSSRRDLEAHCFQVCVERVFVAFP
eukprot:3119187-Amphidinium_carterae.2